MSRCDDHETKLTDLRVEVASYAGWVKGAFAFNAVTFLASVIGLYIMIRGLQMPRPIGAASAATVTIQHEGK